MADPCEYRVEEEPPESHELHYIHVKITVEVLLEGRSVLGGVSNKDEGYSRLEFAGIEGRWMPPQQSIKRGFFFNVGCLPRIDLFESSGKHVVDSTLLGFNSSNILFHHDLCIAWWFVITGLPRFRIILFRTLLFLFCLLFFFLIYLDCLIKVVVPNYVIIITKDWMSIDPECYRHGDCFTLVSKWHSKSSCRGLSCSFFVKFLF